MGCCGPGGHHHRVDLPGACITSDILKVHVDKPLLLQTLSDASISHIDSAIRQQWDLGGSHQDTGGSYFLTRLLPDSLGGTSVRKGMLRNVVSYCPFFNQKVLFHNSDGPEDSSDFPRPSWSQSPSFQILGSMDCVMLHFNCLLQQYTVIWEGVFLRDCLY